MRSWRGRGIAGHSREVNMSKLTKAKRISRGKRVHGERQMEEDRRRALPPVRAQLRADYEAILRTRAARQAQLAAG